MHELIALSDATPQELQLELIRRTRFNNYDGPRVFAALMKHRSLWSAAMLDRPGISPPYGSSQLLINGLIKLRDLPAGIWNADTLYLLTPTGAAARQLAAALEAENLGGDVVTCADHSEIDDALGVRDEGHGLITIWWD